VAFSPLMFVAGTKLMVPKASTIAAPADLKGKTVVVTKGTTNEQAMHNVEQEVLARPQHPDLGPTTSSPTRCWSTARPTPSPPTTSCCSA